MEADFISRDELQQVINERNETCVSIYLPMARVGPDVPGNVIRLKNALKEVEKQLQEEGWNAKAIGDLLEAPRRLLHESAFWQHQSDGLAIFLSPELFERYRLPVDFEPLTLISDRFHIKPLLPLFSDDGRFYILALSQNDARLFQGTRHLVDEIDLGDTPTSMDEALWMEVSEEAIQHHTTTSGAGGAPAAEPSVVHHGQGYPDDEERQRLRRYFNQLSEGVQTQLAGEEAPLVLAAVDFLHPIYKEVADSPHLLDEGVIGNPDEMSEKALHEKAWHIVGPIFAEAKEDTIHRYNELAHTEQASDALETIVPAAVQGRIDALFVAVGTHRWGSYDLDQHEVEVHEERSNGDEDLLDFAAVQTLAYGGTVYAVAPADVPGEGPVAAVYRF